MYDHDQIFKEILKVFFADFFRLFFPAWAERFDFTQVEWLDKEVFPDPPQGERKALDLLAKLPCVVPPSPGEEPGPWLALIHIEVESRDSVAAFRPRMFGYFGHVRAKHNLPVLPIALYLRVGLDGIGWDVYEERFWDQVLVQFHYPYVGLPALDAVQYLHGENYLGVGLLGLMRKALADAKTIKQMAVQRLKNSPLNAMQRKLLSACLDMYLPLEGDQAKEFERWILTPDPPGELPMGMTIQKRGSINMLLEQITDKFGPQPAGTTERLEAMTMEELYQLGKKLLRTTSLEELGLGALQPEEAASHG